MVKALITLTLVAAVLASAGCAVADRSVDMTPPDADLEVRVYEVFGMDCPGCHGGLEKLVLRIPAVQAAEANWEQKKLTVTVKPGVDLDDEDVYEAIRQANFTPGECLQ
jgi:copper chaperone CopZ